MAHAGFFKITISGPGGHGSARHVTKLSGTIRDFAPTVSENVKQRTTTIVQQTCAAFDLQGEIKFQDTYPVVVNPKPETEIVQSVAAAVVGAHKVSEQGLPRCGAEDFAYFLQARPGCFFFIGTKHESDPQNRNAHRDTVSPH
ncbi:unnamed protein product [Aphanomyces euteiches]